ncbi:MAG TPA: hypothetical protein PLQ97_10915 [Myxococcota bacterium]|nr:hypothetical protein [Myxococcota bacterium]HQK51562.1 hypothetical protein [Myxococcota bacterium]
MKRCEYRRSKHFCKGCGQQWARYRFRGEVRWDSDHDLCFRCWRSLLEGHRQTLIAS